MYFNDHMPPYFHAMYGEYNGVFDLVTLEMIEGDMPTRSIKLVQEWAEKYKVELLEMWETKDFKKFPELR